jgi:hypothetical protein
MISPDVADWSRFCGYASDRLDNKCLGDILGFLPALGVVPLPTPDRSSPRVFHLGKTICRFVPRKDYLSKS